MAYKPDAEKVIPLDPLDRDVVCIHVSLDPSEPRTRATLRDDAPGGYGFSVWWALENMADRFEQLAHRIREAARIERENAGG